MNAPTIRPTNAFLNRIRTYGGRVLTPEGVKEFGEVVASSLMGAPRSTFVLLDDSSQEVVVVDDSFPMTTSTFAHHAGLDYEVAGARGTEETSIEYAVEGKRHMMAFIGERADEFRGVIKQLASEMSVSADEFLQQFETPSPAPAATSTPRDVVAEIGKLLEQADKLWTSLPQEERDRLNDVHNYEGSLDHCLRYGQTAAEELLSGPLAAQGADGELLRAYTQHVVWPLQGIAGWAGNLSDDLYESRTGAGDAVDRGLKLTFMRRTAIQALRRLGEPLPGILYGSDWLPDSPASAKVAAAEGVESDPVLKQKYLDGVSALKLIAGWAGNLPDDLYESRTGAGDAVDRGLKLTAMRGFAIDALQRLGEPLPDILKGCEWIKPVRNVAEKSSNELSM